MSLLPKELEHLERVATELAKLPPEEIDECADTSNLEAVLRKRVSGLKLRDAVSRLTEDHKLLKNWIKETKSKEGAHIFLAAYLMRPGPLARQLLAPPPPPEPKVGIDPPKGWKKKTAPRSLSLTQGKLFCVIQVCDKLTFEDCQRRADKRDELQRSSKNPWANLGVWARQFVKFGEAAGEKFVYIQSQKANWKEVFYLIEVPGGFTEIRVGHEAGGDFEESEIENFFHTLRVIPPKCPDAIHS